MMTDLEKLFFEHEGKVINRYPHYLRAYDMHFSRFRGKEICLLEIGTAHGGGPQLWKKYFGPKAKIFGIDSCAVCKKTEEENFTVYIGRQEDKDFLRQVIDSIPKIDIVIDDGSHISGHQIISFEEIFLKMSDEAVYCVEDTHTSYRDTHEGGYKKPGTFIEYCKDLIDRIHARGMPQGMLEVTEYTDRIFGIYFYENLVIIEKSAFSRYGPIVVGTERVS